MSATGSLAILYRLICGAISRLCMKIFESSPWRNSTALRHGSHRRNPLDRKGWPGNGVRRNNPCCFPKTTGGANLQSRVTTLQRALNQLGYKPGNVDGRLDPQTRAAIRAFESVAGLPVDGQISQAVESAAPSALVNSPATSDDRRRHFVLTGHASSTAAATALCLCSGQ